MHDLVCNLYRNVHSCVSDKPLDPFHLSDLSFIEYSIKWYLTNVSLNMRLYILINFVWRWEHPDNPKAIISVCYSCHLLYLQRNHIWNGKEQLVHIILQAYLPGAFLSCKHVVSVILVFIITLVLTVSVSVSVLENGKIADEVSSMSMEGGPL